MSITSLQFSDAGPFDSIEFDFDPRVNVFTGPNNSGKTTALWVLGEILVYPFGMPSKALRSSDARWSLEWRSDSGSSSISGGLPISPREMVRAYEELGFSCYVPAQRHGTDFRSKGPGLKQDITSITQQEIRTLIRTRPDIMREAETEARLMDAMIVSRKDEPETLRRRRESMIFTDASLVSDEMVMQELINLDYASYRQHRGELQDTVESILSISSDITEGFSIEFAGVHEDDDGLYLRVTTPDGEVPLSVLSQGTQSVIHWVARLVLGQAKYYDFSKEWFDEPSILVIDEIDAHLHPSWQRRVIPALMKRFANLQIFCSTHSPLMLAGLKAGQIQLLQRQPGGSISVSTNDSDVGGWTSDEIFRNVLGVENPTDLATAEALRRLGELRRKDSLSEAEERELTRLRVKVGRDIIGDVVAEQIAEFERAMGRDSTVSLEPGSAGNRTEAGDDAPEA